MKIFHKIENVDISPSSLTIGNFDGIHLGHQKILTQASSVLTFSNHPAEVLSFKPMQYLTSLTHRIALLEKFGVDSLILLPFTEKFSKQSPEEFLSYLKKYIPFTHLVLGYDAVIGHQRKGKPEIIQSLGEKFGFSVEYLKPVKINDVIVSSSQIRHRIQTGDLEKAESLLGRPYSIRAPVQRGSALGKSIGFQTANLSVEQLCLPPLGVYAVEVEIQKQCLPGVANLGYAPTLHAKRPPLLEVHILDYHDSLYEQEIEVIFKKYLRPERRFASIEELKNQIQKDIELTRTYLA